jgi:hypothetical protein
MSEKKVVRRSVAIALGVVCIILVAIIGGFILLISGLGPNRHHTDEEYTNLQNQVESLQTEVNDLEAPNVIEVNLTSEDVRPINGTPYLHIYGYLCNTGNDIAYNCDLWVVGYQGSVGYEIVTLTANITMGNILGQSWIYVDVSPTYSGSSFYPSNPPLSDWSILPQWSATQ